jgi:TRAP-type C4-dicarboxylate transport system substrate-binding protein
MKLKTLVLAAAFALPAAFSTSTIAYAEKIEMRVDVFLPEKRDLSKMIGRFVDRVNKAAPDELEFKVYYAGALGIKAADVLRAVSKGSIEMGILYPPYFGRDAPDLALVLPQGVILERAENLVVQPTIRKIYSDYLDTWNIVPLSWLMQTSGVVQVVCKGEPVNTMAQLRKKKLRVWSKEQTGSFEQLGIAAQIVAQADLYVAMQTGVIDCALYSMRSAKIISLQEVADHTSVLHTSTIIPAIIGINKDNWSKLSKKLQDIVMASAKEMDKEGMKLFYNDAEERKAIAFFKKNKSLNFLPPFSAAEQKQFYEGVLVAWEKTTKKIGRRAPEYRAMVIEALNKHRAK